METTPLRADWQQHHVRIFQAYNTLLETLKRLPSQAEVAQHTGLHRNTVSRHLHTLLSGNEALEHCMGYVVQFQNLVNKLMVRAATMSDDRAMRLFFQVMGNTRLLSLLHAKAAEWHALPEAEEKMVQNGAEPNNPVIVGTTENQAPIRAEPVEPPAVGIAPAIATAPAVGIASVELEPATTTPYPQWREDTPESSSTEKIALQYQEPVLNRSQRRAMMRMGRKLAKIAS